MKAIITCIEKGNAALECIYIESLFSYICSMWVYVYTFYRLESGEIKVPEKQVSGEVMFNMDSLTVHENVFFPYCKLFIILFDQLPYHELFWWGDDFPWTSIPWGVTIPKPAGLVWFGWVRLGSVRWDKDWSGYLWFNQTRSETFCSRVHPSSHV